jgi:N-hydroxyarylamine O-acetyltransferase
MYNAGMIDMSATLSRIGFSAKAEPTSAVLFALQRSHLMTVPFENLDIHLGRPIRLDTSALFTKIVSNRRGGYCFELNGLLALLLEMIGFRVKRLSAASANDDGSYKAPFEHLALCCLAADRGETAWLVDVGWGDGPVEPLRIEAWSEQERGGRLYRLRPEDVFFVLEEKTAAGEWIKHYRFGLAAHKLDEFEGMNQYLQTSPVSMFTQKRLCALFRPNGRVTLSDLRLIETRNRGLRGSEEKTEGCWKAKKP